MQLSSKKIIPLAIAVLICSLLFFSIPVKFNKYAVELVGSSLTDNSVLQYLFADVTGDGNDEYMAFGSQEELFDKRHGCTIRKVDQYFNSYSIEQINLKESFNSPQQCVLADYNKNGRDELYIAGVEGNSIYIYGYEYPDLSKPFISVQLDSIARYKGKAFALLDQGVQYDLDKDGLDEIYFSIRNGYPIYPRKIYCWNISKNEIKSSPSTCIPVACGSIDTLPSGKIVITGNGSGSGNYKEWMDIPLSDYYNYAYILNEELEFIFDPIIINEYPASVSNILLNNHLYVFASNYILDKPNEIRKYDLEGNLLFTKKLEKERLNFFLFNEQLTGLTNNNVITFNEDLSEIDRLAFKDVIYSMRTMDLDEDGQDEIIILHDSKKQVEIVSSDLSHSTSINLPFEKSSHPLIRKIKGAPDQLILPDKNRNYYFTYGKNPYYLFQIPYYILLILISILISFRSFSIFEKSIEKRQKLEEELKQLQMLSIKNQVDPHFTLNALNSIDYMYQNDEKEKASKFMVKLSRLVHMTLMSSNDLTSNLFEELDFIRTYCHIEEIRSSTPFNFEIVVDEDIDPKNVTIPKHIVFTYVENAIKHGIRPRDTGGWLKIIVTQTRTKTSISVEDNGIGIEESINRNTSNTQKGLEILRNIINLYKDLNGINISSNTKSSASGTITNIEIPKSKNSI